MVKAKSLFKGGLTLIRTVGGSKRSATIYKANEASTYKLTKALKNREVIVADRKMYSKVKELLRKGMDEESESFLIKINWTENSPSWQ